MPAVKVNGNRVGRQGTEPELTCPASPRFLNGGINQVVAESPAPLPGRNHQGVQVQYMVILGDPNVAGKMGVTGNGITVDCDDHILRTPAPVEERSISIVGRDDLDFRRPR